MLTSTPRLARLLRQCEGLADEGVRDVAAATGLGSTAGVPLGDLRVAVLGVGMMGSDHVRRLSAVISGARPVLVADPMLDRARQVAAAVEGCRAVADPLEAIADPGIDAVLIATPGPTHHDLVLACLQRRLPVLCEKPLAPGAEDALHLVRTERELGSPLVQVGFMRRFDPEYVELKALLDSGEMGRPLLVHCAHRNAWSPPGTTTEQIITETVVHEADAVRFLLGQEVTAVTVFVPRSSAAAPAGVRDPLLVVFETADGQLVDVEAFVSTGLAYEVRTEVVAERGGAVIGADIGLIRTTRGRRAHALAADFTGRFARAYDIEVQRWVDAARTGGIDGPGAWDGYAAAAICRAGVESLASGRRVEVQLADREP